MTTLRAHIHTLTQTHLTNGEYAPPLLQRLNDATVPGNDGGKAGGGGDSGDPIPVNPAAIDLHREINKAARDDYLHYRGHTYSGTLPNLLRDLQGTPWADMPEDWEEYLAGAAGGWVDSILNLLYPKKPRRRLHQPCPACGVKYRETDGLPVLTMNCWDKDEELTHPSKWDAECSGCGAVWSGDELQWLSHTLCAA